MTSAAIYARVSSARQKKDETIGSQTEALREHARRLGLEVPPEWVFQDEGHSGATLIRPGLEALRDLAAQGCLDVVLVWSPDRLARKFAYQALLLEELARCGVRVDFIKNGARGDTPEDQLLVQFQGMFAEYEKAQLMERYRRGKAYRARTGSVNVLGGAPFGYRYIRKTPDSGARYEIADGEASLVTEVFRRYADEGATIADLARWLAGQGARTRTGKDRWDRSVIWAMLRNPAYAGRAVFGKTRAVAGPAGINRVARLQGRSVPRAVRTVDRPREEWTEIPVPQIVDQDTFDRVQLRLADNKRFAGRNTRIPSLLQGLAACTCCGYAYYRTSARTTTRTIYYYRCLGSDNYRYQGGRVCENKPVRADYLDQVVWDHITSLLADPALIRAEIGKRLDQARTADPAAGQRKRLEAALARASKGISSMVEALSEQLITIDELRARMPDLRAREATLRQQVNAIDAQLADRQAYLQLAENAEDFLTRLNASAATATVPDRQRVLRLLVKDILIGPDKITIRHRIPVQHASRAHRDKPDTEDGHAPGYPLCWGRVHHVMREVAEHTIRYGHPPDDQQLDRMFDESFYVPAASKPLYERLKQRGRELVLNYTNDYADDLKHVWETERPFELHLPTAVISGRADVILDMAGEQIQSLAIVDYKTATDNDPEAKAGYDLQLSVYTDAGRREGLNVQAAYVHDLTGHRDPVDVRPEAITASEQTVESSVRDLRQRKFNANPGPRCQQCDLRRLCRWAPSRYRPR